VTEYDPKTTLTLVLPDGSYADKAVIDEPTELRLRQSRLFQWH
jgi:hypothetical protein